MRVSWSVHSLRHVQRACALHSTGLRIKESKEVYEGEVTEMTPEETESEAGGYGKVGLSRSIALTSQPQCKRLVVKLCGQWPVHAH